LFGKTPLKAQNHYIFQKFGGHGPFGPPGYAYGLTQWFLTWGKFTLGANFIFQGDKFTAPLNAANVNFYKSF